MKQKIDPKDIRKGDLIRWEKESPTEYGTNAVECRSEYAGTPCSYAPGRHYLLERPEPPFEPKDGMHIQHEENNSYYSGVRIDGEWLALDEEEPSRHWFNDTWAKEKLASGWVVIEKPEGVE